MKKILNFAVMATLAIWGCSKSNEQIAGEIEFSPNANEKILLSTFVEDVEYVNLEFTNESMIANIDCVYSIDNKYIIADKRGGVVFIFDNKGKFISKINRKGRARNEYLSLDEVRFDEKSGQIIIYDASLEKILYYNLDGNCTKICEIADKNDRFFTDIINLSNGNFLCYSYIHGNSPKEPQFDGVCEMTPEGKIIKWHWTSELIHPTQMPNYTLSYNPQGEISIMCLELDADMIFDGKELKTVADYKPNGSVAADYSGTNNASYAGWINGEYFNSRHYGCNMGRYILSRWWGEKRGGDYYTLLDTHNAAIRVGSEIDYQTASRKRALPTHIFPSNGKEQILPAMSNMRDAVVVPVLHSTLLSEKFAPQAKEILGNIEPENSNPVLQIWKLKR